MAQGMKAYEEDKEAVRKMYSPPTGRARREIEAAKPKPAEETAEQRMKREHDAVLRAKPGPERDAILKRQADEMHRRMQGK